MVIFSSVSPPSGESSCKNYNFALASLTMLFFMWGFITSLNDILIPHLKNVFQLNYTQSMLIQFCFFSAYFIVSLPAGALVKRITYKWGIVTGLLVAAIGCALFIPAAKLQVYPLFLGALFVLASGVTILQVAANPYVTVLGAPETASSRLTLTQAFNSLGTTLAPLFGAFLILAAATNEGANAESEAVQFPYLLLALAFLVLAIVFAVLKLPNAKTEEQNKDKPVGDSAWRYSHLVLGAIGLFLYVGAEVSIGSFLVSFLSEPQIGNLSETQAAHYVSYFWGGAMIGRFVGAAAMRYVADDKMLAFNALAAILLLVLTVFSTGQIAMWSVLALGLFNSIMFPTIFSLALRGLGGNTSQGSGILCLAIVGGAIIPLVQGVLADVVGIQYAFLMPILCYIYIVHYGLIGSKPKA